MSILHICLFGKFSIKSDKPIPPGLLTRKVQELFSYLLLNRGRPHSREALATLLWSDCPTAQSKKYLRQALWQLQTALASTGRVLQVEPDWVQFNLEGDVRLDVAELEQAFNLALGVPEPEMDAHIIDAVQRVVPLYHGDLLEGWYHDWCLYERERLQNIYLILLDKLMAYCDAHHEYEAGLTYGARILRLDRARERTHRRLMRLYYLAGDRTAALRQFAQCVAALNEELGVEPARRTVALYEQIRLDRLDSPASSPSMGGSSEASPSSMREVIERLKQTLAALIDMQRQVQIDLNTVELALRSEH